MVFNEISELPQQKPFKCYVNRKNPLAKWLHNQFILYQLQLYETQSVSELICHISIRGTTDSSDSVGKVSAARNPSHLN